jgi:MFS transporter, ENTS family, enterobactin (siderophore) exporter
MRRRVAVAHPRAMSLVVDGSARPPRSPQTYAAAAGRRLALATAAERAGIWAAVLVLAVDAWSTFGAGAVGLVAAARSLASAAGGPLCSILADSHRPRDLLVGARACAAAVVAAIALAIDLEAGLPTMCALAALLGVVGSVCDPAGGLLRVRLVGDDEARLAVATARHRLAVHSGFLVGSVGAGLLLMSGTGAALLPAAGAFALGAILTATVRPTAGAGEHRRPQGFLRGARIVAGTKGLRAAFGGLALLVVMDGIVDVLVVCAALGYLGGDDAGAGLLQGAVAVGAILGGATILSPARMMSPRVGILAGCVVVSAGLATMAAASWLAVAALVLAVAGVGYVVAEVGASTLVQRLPPTDDVARVLGIAVTVDALAYAAGSAIAGALAASLGARSAFAVAGVAALGATLLLAVALRRASEAGGHSVVSPAAVIRAS